MKKNQEKTQKRKSVKGTVVLVVKWLLAIVLCLGIFVGWSSFTDKLIFPNNVTNNGEKYKAAMDLIVPIAEKLPTEIEIVVTNDEIIISEPALPTGDVSGSYRYDKATKNEGAHISSFLRTVLAVIFGIILTALSILITFMLIDYYCPGKLKKWFSNNVSTQ